ncbi:MAG TPA: hypothetical protein DEP84_21295 [Chloroflexi bacterium]|nr:hypothetical protein [Chloroflexota bacterium]
MNTVLSFLHDNQQRLGLERYGAPARMACVVVTPRFRASSHVVFLLLPEGSSDPALVAKLPRLAGASEGVEREAANLRAVQASRPGGFDSIPRVVAFETYRGRQILLETALVGQPMDRATVRRDFVGCCDAVARWLAELQQPARDPAGADSHWFERLVERPLHHFTELFPLSADEASMLERTWELVAPLRGAKLPLVFEHSDLSAPNLMLLRHGGPGAVDWELATPRGLPTYDLFFFLSYVAFALHTPRSTAEYVSAFHAAFFGQSAWARPYVRAYAERLQLPVQVLTPLFVLCWARYTASLLTRLGAAGRPGESLGADTAAWLRANRYYALWHHTLRQVSELHWFDEPATKTRSN